MPKVSLRTNQAGISLVEVLLAVLLFGMFVTGITGALLYGRASTDWSGNRQRANMLAEEGVEAVRNIRDSSYSNLTDGSFGVTKSGNQWALSGSSDITDNFTRITTVSSNGANRKLVSCVVSWPQGASNGLTSVTTEFTNWTAALPKTWPNGSRVGGGDASGTIAGYKVATVGNYAYLVRNSSTGPNFIIFNVSTPSAPTVVGSLTLAGVPTNIAVSGNYAYVSNTSDTAELQAVNITTPATPTLAASYNASGTGDGLGVFAQGSSIYLSRAANAASDEFVILTMPTSTTFSRVGGYSLNISMYEVYVNGTAAYVATSSDTQEVLVINLSTPATPTLGTSINLTGTVNATTIDGNGTNIVVGQGTAFYTISSANGLIPVVSGTATLSGTINDVTMNNGMTYAFAAVAGTASNQFQIINTSTWTAPSLNKAISLPSTGSLTGVDYNSTLDIVPSASSITTMELPIFGPG